MELTAATTATTTAITGGGGGLSLLPPTKSPEAEPIKPISLTNGVLKRATLHHHHAPPQVSGFTYKECLKNHAAGIGGHALDGCGEFMHAPTATASDPTSLKCAACGCHRNFHRREPEVLPAAAHVIEYHPHHRHHPLPPPSAAADAALSGSQSPPPISSSYYPGSAPHMLLSLSGGGGGGGGPNPENKSGGGAHFHLHHHHNIHRNNHQEHHRNPVNSPATANLSRKRFRTKFSQEQKDGMQEFAEKIGWKMQKSNEEMVNGFCKEIGVERGVFKVWMHNNKHTFGKKLLSGSNSENNIRPGNNLINSIDLGNENGNSHSSSIIHHSYQDPQQLGSSHVPTNASSSSS